LDIDALRNFLPNAAIVLQRIIALKAPESAATGFAEPVVEDADELKPTTDNLTAIKLTLESSLDWAGAG